MSKPKILFVCSKNKLLPFAAGKIAQEKYESYGDFFGCYIGDDTSVTKEESDIYIKFFNTKVIPKVKSIKDYFGKNFDLIIYLSESARKETPQIPGFPVNVSWEKRLPVLNPFSENIEKWLQCFEKELLVLVESGYLSGAYNYKYNMDMIINSLGDAVIAHDLERKIFYFNSTAEKLTGHLQKSTLGKDCHDIFPAPLCGQNCSFCDGGRLDNSFQGKSYKTSFYNKAGERKDCKVNVIPMRDDFGNLRGVTASIRDLTELNQAKEQILKEQSFNGIIGKDPKMLRVFQQIKDLGVYDSPVHIHGETGTGKELVARAIHNESLRKTGPFVPINCGALPEGLIESELFGHVKGSFSGALRDKKGRFELADKGTIFLDEIGDLPKQVQVKLLRFLQEGTLEKVGSEGSVSVDVRIISATNKDLKKAVKDGEFRDDLYYRLNVVPVSLPTLKERKSDIPILCDHFLKKTAKRHNHEKLDISKDALSALFSYHWPGNVRELENVMEYSVIHASGSMILPENLPMEIQNISSMDSSLDSGSGGGKLNREAVLYALEKAGGNKTKAAKILGVGRATLYRFLNSNAI